MAARISPTRLVTPVEVSLCTTMTAFIWWPVSAESRSCTASGGTPCRQSPGTNSTSRPSLPAISCHRVAKWPVSKHSTRSPGDRVLTSAASQAPVPEPG